MKPTFKTAQAWEQAQTLMQPTLIRVVDHLRQRLDASNWQGDYEEVEEPFPGFQLRLTQGDSVHVLNLWDLCFQVCFVDYPTIDLEFDPLVDIDTQLLDGAGEVEWEVLDQKVRAVLAAVFAGLEEVSPS
ncbi:hypothetical protein VB712_19415 [Spirulina sp. CCNP1310]|uniref:hypothetical protein n=1 Tax=Spirulina sp. CCNP1310 TaxID=3110249 RepID=UPI002B1EE85A|nr:hypothetical protein [Spirulina sp. CCNP1310]MEA5421400.1 hypothetical protein [Spirulina sp. CCNP1310]